MSTTISGTNGVTFPDSTSMQTGQQACKAWVNFDGTGTVAIRAQYNVSSITDNGTGNYTVNFTTAMADNNYSVSANGNEFPSGGWAYSLNVDAITTTTITLETYRTDASSNAVVDFGFCSVAIFR